MMARPGRAWLRSGVLMAVLAGPAALSACLDPAGAAGTGLAGQPTALLTAIHASHHGKTDRLVFDFSRLPAPPRVGYVNLRVPPGGTAPVGQGSRPLQITFTGVSGAKADGQTSYGPPQRALPLPGIIQLVTERNRDGVLEFRVGVASHVRPVVTMQAGQARVVIDLPAPTHAGNLTLWFVTSDSATLEPASRPAPKNGRVKMALRRLFAGPTRQELSKGLRFVSSGATGFHLIHSPKGTAVVRLTGGCTPSTAPLSLGSEIQQTLTSLPGISTVTIYDPEGHTGPPDSAGNSVPQCLEPVPPVGPWLSVLLVVTALGLLLGIVLSVLSVVRGLRQPKIITPAAYQAEEIKRHPVAAGQFEPDIAWPVYPLAQMRADLARIEEERQALYGKLWKIWPRPFYIFVLLPLWAAILYCYLLAGLVTLLLGLLYLLASLICAAVAGGLATVGVLVLRGAGLAWRRVLHTAASCPKCYHVTPWPAYRCPGCRDLHRDIRPGQRGVLARRCKCGTLLPTTVLRASRSLEAVCQRCQTPLRAGAAAIRDVRIPVFGDTSAGKTRFLYAAIDSLIELTSKAGIPFGFPDESSEAQAEEALSLIRSGRDTVKTSTDMPIALTCRVGKGTGSALVHLFDAAGEAYKVADRHDSFGFLDRGQGLVYVLDPFSVGAIRERLTTQKVEVIRRAQAAAGDPESAYGEVVTRLRDSGVKASAQRLATVISKSDLLIMGGLEPPTESAEIADWLAERGLHNLVLSMKREFAEVRFFSVASLAAARALPRYDPGGPLHWLLTSQGTRLPAGPGQVAEPRIPRSRDSSADGGRTGSEQGDTAKAVP